jgi:TPR repeat protein
MPSPHNRPAAPATRAADSSVVAADTRASAVRLPRPTNFGPPAAPGEVGTLGPYRVVRTVGSGGMGEVYLAIDTRLRREVALKVMRPEFAADPAARDRFLREACAAARISHDHVVPVYEADERDGVPYIAMPFLRGETLDQFLKTRGTPDGLHVLRIAAETAAGLAAAHELGLVHRDVKPANIWLEAPGGRAKILDFGLARPVAAASELTGTGAVIGTPAYMSPEQAKGEPLDHRTDLFSLGVVLYQLVTGRRPFDGPTGVALLVALVTEEPAAIGALNPHVPPDFAALVHELLAKDPGRRPNSAAEVAARCRAIAARFAPAAPTLVVTPVTAPAADAGAFADLDTEIALAPAPARPPAAAPKPSGGRVVWAAAGLAVLLAVAGVAVVVSRGNRAEPKAAAPPAPPVLAPVAPPPPAKSKADEERLAAEREAQGKQFNKLGDDYRYGRGVERDLAKAREYYEKAAALGNPFAQNNLGYMYEWGNGVPQDFVKAGEWYAKCRPWFEKEAERGDANAQNTLGYLYEYGWAAGGRDYARAMEWYQKAAAQGDAAAIANIGHLHHDGRGVPVGYAKAMELYERAAAQGNTFAMSSLADMHLYGRGTPVNYAKARAGHEKAAALEYAYSLFQLGHLYEQGLGVAKDPARALAYYKRAAAMGNAAAVQGVQRLTGD